MEPAASLGHSGISASIPCRLNRSGAARVEESRELALATARGDTAAGAVPPCFADTATAAHNRQTPALRSDRISYCDFWPNLLEGLRRLVDEVDRDEVENPDLLLDDEARQSYQ